MTEDYEYNVEEKALSQAFLLRYVWHPVQSKIPATVTPNQITICGFFAMILSTLSIYLAFQGHTWGFITGSVFLLLYMSADNLDGIHARTTGQSSRLGEFLDHWLDTLSSVAVNVCIFACMQLDGMILLVVLSIVVIAFFATLWEHHHTGVFQSGTLGTNEAILMISGMYVVLFFIWGVPWLQFSSSQLNVASVLIYSSTAVSAYTAFACIWRVKKHLLDFSPLLFSIAALVAISSEPFVLELANSFSVSNYYLIAIVLLTLNIIYTGGLVTGKLLGQSNFLRNWLGIFIPCLAFLAVYAKILPQYLPYLFYVSVGLILMAIVKDLSQAVLKLRD